MMKIDEFNATHMMKITQNAKKIIINTPIKKNLIHAHDINIQSGLIIQTIRTTKR